jgi:aryl-alcohol dehydrogenase-like predicted oxidoreductase
VEELRPLVPEGMTMAQMALRWILDHAEVSTVIPGARRPARVSENDAVSELPPLPPELHERLAAIYRARVAPLVHQRW